MDAAETVAKCWPHAEEYEVRRSGTAGTVGSRAVVIVHETSQGYGRSAGWNDTIWIVDPGTCRKVGMSRNGSLGSYRVEAYLEGTPSAEERAWLLKDAGYVACDPKRPAHALGACVEQAGPPEVELTVPGFPGKVTRIPPGTWHSGPVPTFTTSWCAVPPDPGAPGSPPWWWVAEPEGMVDHRSTPLGGRVLHTLATQARVPTGVQIIEDTVGKRWMLAGDVVEHAEMMEGVPPELAAWHWEKQYSLDPGVWRVVAYDLATGTRSAFAVESEDVAWVPDGLRVVPLYEEPPVVVPTEVLRRAIVGR